jgi:hypothetical protein
MAERKGQGGGAGARRRRKVRKLMEGGGLKGAQFVPHHDGAGMILTQELLTYL